MNTTSWISILLFCTAIICGACSDDFLKLEDKDSYIMTDTLDLVGHVEEYTVRLSIPPAKNSAYSVRIYPKWIDLEYMEGRFDDGYAYITLSTANEDLYTSREYTGKLVFDIKDFGYLELVSRYRRK